MSINIVEAFATKKQVLSGGNTAVPAVHQRRRRMGLGPTISYLISYGIAFKRVHKVNSKTF